MGCGAFHCKECQRLASEVTSCIYLVLLWLAFHLWNFMALFIFGLAFNLCSSWLGHYFNMPTWVTEGILAVPCNFVNLLFLFYSKNFKCWFSICYPCSPKNLHLCVWLKLHFPNWFNHLLCSTKNATTFSFNSWSAKSS